MLDFELNQLQERSRQLEEELNENIDKGDNQFTQLKDEVKGQNQAELKLTQELNSVANRSNLILRSKLNQNKSDFERLRHLGTADSAIGKDLERQVAQNDQKKLEVMSTQKESHKGLITIRDVMKCDIGKDQKPYKPDLKQVDHMCQLLDEKDAQLLTMLTPSKDKVEKEYLANQVSNGLRDIMNGDKVDIEQHIDFNNSGMEKLTRMTEKHKLLQQRQENKFVEQDKTIVSMKQQIEILSEEKNMTREDIQKNKKELASLKAQLDALTADGEKQDEATAALEAKIDDKYNEMEVLEQEIDMKIAIIKDLERALADLQNKKILFAPRFEIYKPQKGEELDETLAVFINEYASAVPWRRISEGNYTYGTKKVNVRYMRQHLIVKVGGGSMKVEEFVANYEDIELAKLNTAAYVNPAVSGVSGTQPDGSGLTKQQRIAMARAGGSPRVLAGLGPGSPRPVKS